MATGLQVLRTYDATVKAMEADPTLVAVEKSAGFILPPGKKGTRKGYQVFVKVYRYDETLLTEQPESGGLLMHRRAPAKAKKKVAAPKN